MEEEKIKCAAEEEVIREHSQRRKCSDITDSKSDYLHLSHQETLR